MKIYEKFRVYILILILIPVLNSCSAKSGKIWDPADARKVDPNADVRARQAIEEGRAPSLSGIYRGKNKGGAVVFASENPMWRATLEILDFIPLANVDYSGGLIITDWYGDDTTMNAVAIEQLQQRHPDAKLVLLESGGDNLSATFSPELVDAFIFVIDVAEGDKIPRKGGPAIRHSDLLIINKTDLAPLVGADLEVMDRDSKKMREGRPFLFTDLKTHKGLDAVVEWLTREFLF